jgi:phospholipid transport system transporter-binding protein
MAAKLVALEPSSWRVEGSIDYYSVLDLRNEGERQMAEGEGPFRFDFEGVDQVNTAGLALLLCWRRWAAAHRVSLALVNLPAELRSIARISDLEELLDNGTAATESAG